MSTAAPSQFDKRFLIFTGKGGAGKSTVTAAAAVAAARRGKRVLIVEVGDEERIAPIFRAPAAGYGGARVYAPAAAGAPPVWSMCVTAREALREFAIRSMKFEALYGAVFENKVVRYFTAAAPGLDELTMMGKIESMHREALAPARNPRFDLMLFDAPATGHGLAFFNVPRMAMRMVRAGPLYAMVERMWDLLADPSRTALNIVTLAEEMSVNESIELDAAAEALGMPRGKTIVNAVYPDLFGGQAAALRAARERQPPSAGVARAVLDRAASALARRTAQEGLIATLAAALPRDRIVLPHLFRPRIGPAEVERLADHLAGL